MMTLIALAITVAYAYSALVVFGLPGSVFFWETATLIDIMLLGHWIEMRSVLGASRALDQLVRLLPAEAHRLRADGSIEEVPLDARSEEHTSELQSRLHLVCRLLLEKKKKNHRQTD